MNRQEKQLVIESLKNDFMQSQGSFLIGIQGMTVGQIQLLRKGLSQQGGKMKLAKNTLLKIAARDIPGVEKLEPYFKEQVGIIFVGKESPAVAKVLCDTAKENELLKLVAGYIDARVIDKNTITRLASLPSRDILIARLCATMLAPIMSLAVVLKQVSEKQQEI